MPEPEVAVLASDPSPDAELTARVKALALELGFARVGVARAERLGDDAARLQSWLRAGHHGSMSYMERSAEVRVDPAHPDILRGARSVIALAMPFATSASGAGVGEPHARIARYALGRDYHNVLRRKLRRIERLLRDAGHGARGTVDSKPLLERAWAQRAGIGFIGKNCCLIVPGLGSHVFLATVVTRAELVADAPMSERCGECEACLHACPTRAFVAPRELDARRCISYLTIEHRGAIEPELRPSLGSWLFGCDACQDVCPWNRAKESTARTPAAFEPRAVARELEAEPEALLDLDAEAFARRFEGSPLRRASRDGLARNAALVLGNRRDKRALPLLERAALSDPAETVRDAARWARARLLGEA